MFTHDIFLSHNGADKAWTRHLADQLEQDKNGRKLKVFFDEWDIFPGSDVSNEIEKGIKESRYVGLVMTPEAFKSKWVAFEMSMAIYRDPAARERSIIPLFRKSCEIPLSIERLTRIDFRNRTDHQKHLEILLATLRGAPLPRGNGGSSADLERIEDHYLLEQHIQAFERSAYRVSCIYELFIDDLNQAIDDTQLAINTGKLVSREKHEIATYSSARHFRTVKYSNSFDSILVELQKLKFEVEQFTFTYMKNGSKFRGNFYSIFMDIVNKGDAQKIRSAIKDMDGIDTRRNKILEILNDLQPDPKLKLIELSSSILKKGQMGGSSLSQYFK
ncbi:MAG TPA: toll/interleukin-1 receptor domain-containing protein [Cyclobacteriaceae bacterium]|nr:toll/interleukin-1 receptor domain-containing protein [Cyclobacteriaceae bacterium]HMV08149.1 toll/interleukin-1 receptor domain-containing protein [Cyclobacteriaceae bacterium]HMX00790.1 toll/interleukin-1 receptor domain-containing protein [Cyclobacteriaceae bacterium]HMX49335.1 toll/interleukin-1 receptor domain-containing protein [Cyclobacteriaceae bacterium]HMY93593.1 toll/interleukin-1 receptor domain-containing protein [Cyclobacteriaceae bacterium]